jgi:hypothetical protein
MSPADRSDPLLALTAHADAANAEVQRYSAGTMPSATAAATSWCASVMPSCADLTIRWAIFALVAGVRDVTGIRSDAASRAQRMVVTKSGAKAVVICGILGSVGLPQPCSR